MYTLAWRLCIHRGARLTARAAKKLILPFGHENNHAQIDKLKDGTARAKKTELINRYYLRTTDGRLVPQEDAPYFRDLRERVESKFCKEKKSGAPTVFIL